MRLSAGVTIVLFCASAIIVLALLLLVDTEAPDLFHTPENSAIAQEVNRCMEASKHYDTYGAEKCPEHMYSTSQAVECAKFLKDVVDQFKRSCFTGVNHGREDRQVF